MTSSPSDSTADTTWEDLHGHDRPHRKPLPHRPHPVDNGPTNLVWGIFLNEMDSGHRHLGCVGHPRTKLTSESLARIAPDSAFRNSLGTLLVASQSA
jgi:hypothetical protein